MIWPPRDCKSPASVWRRGCGLVRLATTSPASCGGQRPPCAKFRDGGSTRRPAMADLTTLRRRCEWCFHTNIRYATQSTLGMAPSGVEHPLLRGSFAWSAPSSGLFDAGTAQLRWLLSDLVRMSGQDLRNFFKGFGVRTGGA